MRWEIGNQIMWVRDLNTYTAGARMFGVKGALAFIFLLLFLPPSSHGASRNRCRACKEFVESFEKGLRATENSNFAGGDVSWEEEKLGSYANSEVRLVEILDTVCSRSNHECHNLVENHEEHIERWWFKLRHSGKKDLKTWFCFNHLDVCCPENTYGPTCKECPGGVGNVCGGRGKCEGAEEMDGSGTCSCEKGYEGDTCESCASGFYNDSNSCLACDKACLDDCTGPGPESCEECGSGYVEEGDGEEVVCRDKDECTEDDSLCKEGTYCFNTPGSYKCNACDKSCKKGCTGPGPAKCVECKAGYDRTDLGVCKDKDECEEPPCSDGTFCENTPGSYVCKACHVSCVLACTGPGAGNCFECKGGYSRENGTCTDINECDQSTSPCDKDTETCHNLVGTHVCKCKRGLVRTDGKCVEEVEEEDRPTEPPTPKPKKKKKKKKTEGKEKEEEVEHQPMYPWYYTIGPLALLFLTQKYIQPNLALNQCQRGRSNLNQLKPTHNPTTIQTRHMTSPMHHMTSPMHHMTSPMHHMTSPMHHMANHMTNHMMNYDSISVGNIGVNIQDSP